MAQRARHRPRFLVPAVGGLTARSPGFRVATLALVGFAAAALWRSALPHAERPASRPRPEASVSVARPPTSGQILVVTAQDAANRFGAYLGEVLASDGWPGVAVVDAESVSGSRLAKVRVIVLTEGALPRDATSLLQGWVARGGVLLAMRPAPSLAPLTGVRTGADLAGAVYVEVPVDRGRGGAGLVPVHLHGPVARLHLDPGTTVRAWSPASDARERLPLVTTRQLGEGAVSAWAFDLGLSLALTRQGNPAWADDDRDGTPGIRAVDAFAGFVDLDRIDAPGADLLVRFCRALVRQALQPLEMPRLWPLPGPSVLVVTSDAHGSTVGAIEAGLDAVERRGGHVSLYYMPRERTGGRVRRAARDAWHTARDWVRTSGDRGRATPTGRDVAAWRQRGHEFAVHPDNGAGSAAEGLERALGAFEDLAIDVDPGTVRTHRVAWSGWVESARAQRQRGFRMNLDAYQVGPALRRANGTWAHGFLTGSGFPWRFVDQAGSLLDIYQLPTQLVDEQLLAGAYDGFEALDAEQARAVGTALVAAAARWNTPVTLQFHTDFLEAGHPLRARVLDWLGHVLDEAVARRLAVMSAADLLRHTACLEDTIVEAWEGGSASGPTGVRVRVPPGCQLGLAAPTGTVSTVVPPDRTVNGAAPAAVSEWGGERVITLPAGTHEVELRRRPVASDSHNPSASELHP